MTYRIMIIDGNSLAYPAFAAAGDCLKPFLNRLLDWRDKYQPMIIMVAWDRPDGSQLRKDVYPGYKAKRPPKPPEFYEQVEKLHDILCWLGVAQCDGPGEADDVIATVTRTRPWTILIASTDKDLIQLVNPGIDQLRFVKPHQMITYETCKEVTGKTPSEWLTYQTLAGDPTDGVPGLPGVGPKTAKRLMEACPSIVELLLDWDGDDQARAAIAENDPRMGKWVELAIKERELLGLTRKLVELQTIEIDWILPDPDSYLAGKWLDEHGLSWIARWWYST